MAAASARKRWLMRVRSPCRVGAVAFEVCGCVFELVTGVAFVTDHEQLAVTLDAAEQSGTDLAFGGFGSGERERAGRAVEGEQAVQAETPEEAAVAGAPAVVGGVGELAAPGRVDAAGALHRGRVDQHEIVVEAGTIAGELTDQRLDRVRQPPLAFVEAGAAGQPGKQMREPFARRLQEPLIGREAQLDWATQSVTTSASVTVRRAFPARLGRRSSHRQ